MLNIDQIRLKNIDFDFNNKDILLNHFFMEAVINNDKGQGHVSTISHIYFAASTLENWLICY